MITGASNLISAQMSALMLQIAAGTGDVDEARFELGRLQREQQRDNQEIAIGKDGMSEEERRNTIFAAQYVSVEMFHAQQHAKFESFMQHEYFNVGNIGEVENYLDDYEARFGENWLEHVPEEEKQEIASKIASSIASGEIDYEDLPEKTKKVYDEQVTKGMSVQMKKTDEELAAYYQIPVDQVPALRQAHDQAKQTGDMSGVNAIVDTKVMASTVDDRLEKDRGASLAGKTEEQEVPNKKSNIKDNREESGEEVPKKLNANQIADEMIAMLRGGSEEPLKVASAKVSEDALADEMMAMFAVTEPDNKAKEADPFGDEMMAMLAQNSAKNEDIKSQVQDAGKALNASGGETRDVTSQEQQNYAVAQAGKQTTAEHQEAKAQEAIEGSSVA